MPTSHAACSPMQRNPHLRTLIHCDYVLSVTSVPCVGRVDRSGWLQCRRASRTPVVLKWNGFEARSNAANLIPSVTSPGYS